MEINEDNHIRVTMVNVALNVIFTNLINECQKSRINILISHVNEEITERAIHRTFARVIPYLKR